MIDDLASLVSPLSEAEFIRHFVEKRRLVIKTAQPGRAASLFPWPTINALIGNDLVPPEKIKMIRSGTQVPAQLFRHAAKKPGLRAGVLQTMTAQGVSIVIDGLDDQVPQVGRLADALGRRLGHKVWVNTYLSFAREKAFKAHHDTHDVVILQVHGSKRWYSFGTHDAFPVDDAAPCKADGPVIWEGVLEPGDLLYLPRGEVHEAKVEGPHSVHLTIGISPRHGLHFLEWLGKKAAEDEVFRMDLPRLAGSDAMARHERLLKEHLHSLIDRTDIATYLELDDVRATLRPLLSLGSDGALQHDSMILPALRRFVELSPEIDREVEVMIGGERFRLSAAARRVLLLLLKHNKISFSGMLAEIGTTMPEAALQEIILDLVKRGLAAVASNDKNAPFLS